MSLKTLFALLLAALPLFAGNTIRPGLENIESIPPGPAESALIDAIKTPFLTGMDVTDAMQDWFDGRQLDTQGKRAEAVTKWKDGLKCLNNLKPLPPTKWGPLPDATFKTVAPLKLASHKDVNIQVVQWLSGNLNQYGIIIYPADIPEGTRLPLILYCHGAAFGLPNSFINELALLAKRGYAIIGPAMRGEMLFQWNMPVNGREIRCDGEIENLDGEVDDCLSMLAAAWKLPFIRKNEFAMFGHSFGAGVGLLTVARAGTRAKAAVSYDAWLVNPQRFCWDRMRRAARNWDSWEDFCNQPVPNQLNGLVKRSIVLNAEHLQCPLLLFMGGAYDGSVFHLSHDDLRARLDLLHKKYQYVLIPNGGHNTVLYPDSKPALFARKLHDAFLNKNYPPAKLNAK